MYNSIPSVGYTYQQRLALIGKLAKLHLSPGSRLFTITLKGDKND